MDHDMQNNKSLVTAGIVIAELDLARNCFKNVFDRDKTVIPGRA
jgi:hypothetical protein